ncbi:MAG: AAA family ATPase [Phaeodactylibacter sp.]|nr:AAA family ATPase [Phaeodactylibacter sp.]
MAGRKKILKGNSDFKYIVGNNGYFVDKTLLIKAFYENDDHVLLMPRPRRFGKTLNLSMIEYFFMSTRKRAPLFEKRQGERLGRLSAASQRRYREGLQGA